MPSSSHNLSLTSVNHKVEKHQGKGSNKYYMIILKPLNKNVFPLTRKQLLHCIAMGCFGIDGCLLRDFESFSEHFFGTPSLLQKYETTVRICNN